MHGCMKRSVHSRVCCHNTAWPLRCNPQVDTRGRRYRRCRWRSPHLSCSLRHIRVSPNDRLSGTGCRSLNSHICWESPLLVVNIEQLQLNNVQIIVLDSKRIFGRILWITHFFSQTLEIWLLRLMARYHNFSHTQWVSVTQAITLCLSSLSLSSSLWSFLKTFFDFFS